MWNFSSDDKATFIDSKADVLYPGAEPRDGKQWSGPAKRPCKTFYNFFYLVFNITSNGFSNNKLLFH
jgi:hypothetical protein